MGGHMGVWAGAGSWVLGARERERGGRRRGAGREGVGERGGRWTMCILRDVYDVYDVYERCADVPGLYSTESYSALEVRL